MPTLTEKYSGYLAREYPFGLGHLNQTQIFATIDYVEGLNHFDENLQEAGAIIFSRENLAIDLPPEKCNMAGKPTMLTRVVDGMTGSLRLTREEATDVAYAVLDGSNATLLGAKTLRALYPVEPLSIVGKIRAEIRFVNMF
ncbi:pyruvate kinase 1, cytosolic-like [Bidens hawaiensis]|uniref:pyruvate kinase 1, cytosolic-like n=1 Tax=Bidens hawaiensis TaxID=980011 RepID=UPI00404AF1A1